jgi:hypothetical protein
MWSFLVALYDLHDVIYRAKGVDGVIEVPSKAVGVVAVSVGVFVFLVHVVVLIYYELNIC